MVRDFKLAISYARTSTTTNSDGDSEPRQRKAIEAYASRAGLRLVDHAYDVLPGASDIEARPAFDRILRMLHTSNVGVVVVEDISRFARESLVGQLGLAKLSAMGVRLVSAKDGKDYAKPGSAIEQFQVQLMLAVAELEKNSIVERLRSGRAAVIAATGRCGGWQVPQAVIAMARALHAEKRSLRSIAKRLAEAGHLSHGGRVYSAGSVKNMLA